MVKVIIAGGRNFENYKLLKFKCEAILSAIKEDIQIVSGGAKGADLLGEKYAKEKHFVVKRFEAEWDKEGKAAGPIRNSKMVEYSDYLIAFWDGSSIGTKDIINKSVFAGLKVRIIKYA